MNRFRDGAWLLAIASVVIGCGAEPAEEPSASSEQGIFYGDSAAANLAVVELKRNLGGPCTGFFISARHIVTAAHCTDSWYSGQWYTIRVKTGYTTYANIRDTTRGDNWVLLGETHYPSFDFNAQTANSDVAILTLPTTAYVPYAQAKQRIATSAPYAGESLAIWGWGRRRTTDTTTSNDLLSGYAGEQVVVGEVSWNGSAQRFTAVRNNYAATCDGDSGGPATRYTNGHYVAVGAHRGASTRPCADWGATMYWASLADKATWIQNVVGASGIACTKLAGGYMQCF